MLDGLICSANKQIYLDDYEGSRSDLALVMTLCLGSDGADDGDADGGVYGDDVLGAAHSADNALWLKMALHRSDQLTIWLLTSAAELWIQ